MVLQETLGFLGFGNMGKAIAAGLLETGVIAPKHLAAYDLYEEKRNEAEALGATTFEAAHAFAAACDMIVLATKPQDMDAAIEGIKSSLPKHALVISIAAGISISFIQQRLGADRRVVRVMPNTPALVNAGATGMAISATCTESDIAKARAIFEAIGIVEVVPEEQIDVVTALSGSGPAYFFYMVECLVRAAMANGLPEAQATRLAAQTLAGSGLLLKHSGEAAATLRARVTSKGGTTEAALKRFEADGFESIIAAGVNAAAARARELGM
ncbi:MAG: pyrroline-5-carboxylate reductase [Candidatus Hydrogenedentes bacterium]|nr:pyrroline-5-carboxylate reductase [Candidatus Hydrogenedentota bacterium]